VFIMRDKPRGTYAIGAQGTIPINDVDFSTCEVPGPDNSRVSAATRTIYSDQLIGSARGLEADDLLRLFKCGIAVISADQLVSGAYEPLRLRKAVWSWDDEGEPPAQAA